MLQLETSRLLLWPVVEADLPFLLELWNDPRVMRYAGFPEGRNWAEHDILKWFTDYQRSLSPDEPEEVHWVVGLHDGERIGESGCGKVPQGFLGEGYAMPKGRVVCMTDVKLTPGFWRSGYATEALQALLAYYFTKTRMNVLLVPPHRENVAALRLYARCGFREVGPSPWPEHALWALTREEYTVRRL